MTNDFQAIFKALEDSGAGLVQMHAALVRLAEAAAHASDEHDDQRETIAQLKDLVLSLQQDVRDLRRDLRGES